MLSSILLMLMVAAGNAQDSQSADTVRSTIAVLELVCNGVSASECRGLSNRLRTELFSTGKFDVVERSRMEEILKEQGFQQSGCTDEACAIEIGQLLNVSQIALGSVDKIGKTISVNARLVDVGSGRIKKSVVHDCAQCSIDEVLVNVMKIIAAKLAGIESAPTALKQDNATATKVLKPVKRRKKEVNCLCSITADKPIAVYIDGERAGMTPVNGYPISFSKHRISAYNLKELAQYKDRLKKLERSRNRRERALAAAIRERLKLGTIHLKTGPDNCPLRIHFDVRPGRAGKRPVFIARQVTD